MQQPIKKIVIVGGGTAGWTAAAMLSSHFPPGRCQIEVVESEEIGTVGVGESTLPPFVRLLQKLGINEQDFVQSTQGCYKLGIRFVDWLEQKHSYFHPFGALGRNIGNHDFYQCWLKARQEGPVAPLMAFSPCAAMAEAGRFYQPTRTGGGPAGTASYALHMDAALVTQYLRGYAKAKGVRHTEGRVTAVTQHTGNIESIRLDSGQTLSADFFIDCTGFSALLIEKALGVGFKDWSELLPCDRSVSVKAEAGDVLRPYTQATARKAGWSWRIPLRYSTGHGYVYSSRFCSDAQAKSILLKSLDTPRISEPRFIPFTPGHREEMWKGNCLSLGLSAGFIEPLESTSIHLIARGVEFFLRYFPDTDCDPALIREYNRRMSADYEEIRDFILLHYCTSQRTDSDFWNHCRQLPVPDSLQQRIDLFRAQGLLREQLDPLFRPSSWQAVFEGMDIRPRRPAPHTDTLDINTLRQALEQTRAAVKAITTLQPAHEEYLRSLHTTSD
jgi:tryptophan 7-halogenase